MNKNVILLILCGNLKNYPQKDNFISERKGILKH